MKLQNGDSIMTGVTEVSVKEIISLEKSISEKDQTIGALRAQIKTLEEKIEDVKADAIAKQAMVLIQKTPAKKSGQYITCTACGYNYHNTSYTSCPNCNHANPYNEEIREYKNLDTVVENIRKDQATKLGIDLLENERKVNELNLSKQKLQNQLDFEVNELKERLKQTLKDKEADIQAAKEKIRKHLGGIVDEQQKEIDDLKDTLHKVKKDKTDEAVEEARKQEIIDLKERIHELENVKTEVPNYGWFKLMLYNWLKVDGRAKVTAERENLEKKERVQEISNNYPKSNSFWMPNWASTMSDPWNW